MSGKLIQLDYVEQCRRLVLSTHYVSVNVSAVGTGVWRGFAHVTFLDGRDVLHHIHLLNYWSDPDDRDLREAEHRFDADLAAVVSEELAKHTPTFITST